MIVLTSKGSTYSYNPYDNSISDGLTNRRVPFKLEFKPLTEIAELDKIDSYTICVTENCNLRCTYCCYSGIYPEHRIHSNNSFKESDIPNIISFIGNTVKSDYLNVEFYGGECLLELDWIKSFVAKVKEAFHEKEINLELSTNGILLREPVSDWIIQNNFHLFISIDGIGKLHDLCRKDVNGRGTFPIIHKNLAYIKSHYPSYWDSNVNIMMTIRDISLLPCISKEWSASELLSGKMPIRISEVATIYNSDTIKVDFELEKQKYLELVKYRIHHPDEPLIKAFFDIWLAEWINRPIFEIKDPVEYPTCLPHNKKLYIDAKGNIGICERITDEIRIGNITDGLNYSAINNVVCETASFIDNHCSNCASARICDICPDILRLPMDVVQTYCNNQRIMHRIKLLCFCELAELELI
jgi:uncharacterized protein